MSIQFQDKWREYKSLWWKKYCPIPMYDLFPVESIIVWGTTPYLEYKKSQFFIHNPIMLNNTQLCIYYYCRKISGSDQTLLFFFANTIDFRNHILRRVSDNIDIRFLKGLYENSISISNLFHHKYNENCWESILMEKETEWCENSGLKKS
jgi:hypothetical protein